ncbi:hypothetical protein [Streptomyces sp. NPDC001450]
MSAPGSGWHSGPDRGTGVLNAAADGLADAGTDRRLVISWSTVRTHRLRRP